MSTSGFGASEFPWRFLAEGKMHACYQYAPQTSSQTSNASPATFATNTTDPRRNKILRVAKSDIVRGAVAANRSPSTSDDEECKEFPLIVPATARSSCHPNLRYILEVVRPLLGPQYVDIPQRAIIRAGFAAKLWRVAIDSGKIAHYRAASWDLDDGENNENNKNNNRIEATVLFDHTKISIPALITNCSEGTCLSVEIKPKAGYISCSPLVDPRRRIKLAQTKYWIHQQLMAKGRLKKGWGSLKKDDKNESVASSYNPLDLFSLEKIRIQHALRCLLEHPQNNLRVWYDGKILIGHDTEELGDSQVMSILQRVFPHTTASGTIGLQDAIVETVSEILMKEPLLSRLHIGQTLDFIDTDGAILIWKHLVQLCNGDLNKAEKLIDQYQGNVQSIDDHVTGDTNTNRAGGVGLRALRDRIVSFREEMEIIRNDEKGLPDAKWLDEAYTETSELIGHLNKEESVQVLAAWLLSLSMCDLSFFVTLRPALTPTTTSGLRTETSSNMQTEDSLGCLTVSQGGGAPPFINYFYMYSIKVVDCDMKPSRKLRNREEAETVMDGLKC